MLSCLVYEVSKNVESVDQYLKKPQITSLNVQNPKIVNLLS